jgi:peptidylprolyl isomerase
LAEARTGDRVKVHYTGSVKDGAVFDSSRDREPFEFTIGQGMVIPGFESGILGMVAGETKTVSIPVDKGYGDHREDLVFVVERSHIPDHIKPELGMILQINSPEGQMTNVTITGMDDSAVTLDCNHPLAGKDLVFEIQLVSIA